MKKSVFWWILAAAVIIAVIGWYVATIMEQPVIFAVCAIIAALIGGFCMSQQSKMDSKAQEAILQQMMQSDNEMKAAQYQAKNELGSSVENCAARISQEIADLANQNANENQATQDQVDEAAKALQLDIAALQVELAAVPLDIMAMKDELKQHVEAAQTRINNTLKRNEEARQKDTAEIASVLDSMDESFVVAAESYAYMETRMAALERQNATLQYLTTLMGTVRSDIALINEVRGFKKEFEDGRKVRITRDDANGVVVESLMNGDGVRIEKSKMYIKKKLVFDADFDANGRMVASRCYDDDGDVDTEVTYLPDEKGKANTVDKLMQKAISILKGIKK